MTNPLQRTADGKYLSNYARCECGEEYLEQTSHVRDSPRHAEWLGGGIEVPVPPQPLTGMYPIEGPRPKLVLGETVICRRCQAKRGDKDTYCPDPDKWRKGAPCTGCNGWGIVPNQGLIGGKKRG